MRRFTVTVITLFFLLLPLWAVAEEEGNGGGGFGIKWNGAVGASIIDGKTYQYFALRPDLSIGPIGIGFDLSLYFDADGNIREEDWDDAQDALDKIYYIRWKNPGDPFYARVGSLEPITLGYGLIMRRYTNAIEWPSVRRIGLSTQINTAGLHVAGVIGNFHELKSPGLVGGRVAYDIPLPLPFPLQVGGTFAYDGNQFLGAPDKDGDGVPDKQDQFPGKKDADEIADFKARFPVPADRQWLIDRGFIPDVHNPPMNIADTSDAVAIYGVDVGMPIIQNENVTFAVYAQMAKIQDFGTGIAAPGALFTVGPFRAGAEFRMFQEDFAPEFFSMGYETERITWDQNFYKPDSGKYVTKKERLNGIPASKGVYADAGIMIAQMVDVYAAYSIMMPDSGDSQKSFYSAATLTTDKIPKLRMAQVYFQQPTADKLFSTEQDGTIMGYKVGLDMGGGVTLIYDQKTIYIGGEPTQVMTIETALTF